MNTHIHVKSVKSFIKVLLKVLLGSHKLTGNNLK